MKIKSFSVENYRAFSKHQKIEVKPITLFFGWNSGGKSSLVRFLPLLAESIKENSSPIWLSGAVGRKMSWSDLVSKSLQKTNIQFSIEATNPDNINAEWDIYGSLDGQWQSIRSIKINNKVASPENDSTDGDLSLFPEPFQNLLSEHKHNIQQILATLGKEVQWISGVRTAPSRLVSFSGASGKLRPDGSDTLEHLIKDKLNGSALQNIINKFFNSLGDNLEVNGTSETGWRLLLNPLESNSTKVNICDTGEGYMQVLPVLVALAKSRVDESNILCIEQPELHLHTKAQRELAKLIVETVNFKKDLNILLETHSEVLLTSIQLAIAQGLLKPEMVRVYWVESSALGLSSATAVDFDENGKPTSNVLINAFSEAIEIGHELLRQQLKLEP